MQTIHRFYSHPLNHIIRCLLGLVVLVQVTPIWAQDLKPVERKQLVSDDYIDQYKNTIHSTVLKNGISVIKKDIDSDITYLQFRVEWNSRELKKEDRLIPTFVAALLTKSTKTYPRGVIEEQLDRYAIDLSCKPEFRCDTSNLSMSCSLALDNEYLDKGLDLLSSVIKEPTFNEADYDIVVKNSKIAIQSECRRGDHQITNRLVNKIFYNHDHPFFTTEDHLIQSVEKMTRQKLVDGYAGVFNAHRMSFFVASSLSPAQLTQKLNSYFSGIPRWYVDIKKPLVPQRYQQRHIADYVAESGVQGDNVYMILKTLITPGILGPHSTANLVLHRLLSDMLYTNIRTKRGISYAPGSYNSGFRLFEVSIIYASTSQPLEVLNAVQETLKDIKTNLVDEQKLYEVKLKILTQFYENISNPTKLLDSMARHYMNHGHLDRLLNFSQRLEAVDSEFIRTLANQHLKNYQLALYGPQGLISDIKTKDLTVP